MRHTNALQVNYFREAINLISSIKRIATFNNLFAIRYAIPVILISDNRYHLINLITFNSGLTVTGNSVVINLMKTFAITANNPRHVVISLFTSSTRVSIIFVTM